MFDGSNELPPVLFMSVQLFVINAPAIPGMIIDKQDGPVARIGCFKNFAVNRGLDALLACLRGSMGVECGHERKQENKQDPKKAPALEFRTHG
jgi:hypothetical protein